MTIICRLCLQPPGSRDSAVICPGVSATLGHKRQHRKLAEVICLMWGGALPRRVRLLWLLL